MAAPRVLSTTMDALPLRLPLAQEEPRAEAFPRIARSRVVMPARTRARRLPLFSWRTAGSLCLLAANVLVLGWYVLSVNTHAGLGYQGYLLQQELAGLRDQQRALQVQIAERGSTARVQEQVVRQQAFVPVGTPEFIVATANNVSMR